MKIQQFEAQISQETEKNAVHTKTVDEMSSNLNMVSETECIEKRIGNLKK